MLGARADGLRSLRERWTVGRRMDGARGDSPWGREGVNELFLQCEGVNELTVRRLVDLSPHSDSNVGVSATRGSTQSL